MLRLARALVVLGCLTLAACEPAPAAAPVPQPAGPSCAAPPDLRPAPVRRPPADEIVADEPIAYHVLAISWSPQACRSLDPRAPAMRHQCRGQDGQTFGFILHGLWPNGAERRHPRYCRPAGPALEAATVREHFCMTPSPVLLQRQWAAHGTCAWDSPEAYFDQAADLWNGLTLPDMEVIPPGRMTAGTVRDAFVAANPGLPRAALWIMTSDDQGLREVRICHDRAFQPMACPFRSGARDHEPLRLARRETTPN